jgi:membrane associated rhomboid family serine protease
MISQLVLINVAVFLLQQLIPEGMLYRLPFGPAVSGVPNGFALVPSQVLTKGMVWELFTYMFLHGGFMHILLNMFYLIMFGSELERWWGSRDFFKYYTITGVGAGVIHVLTSYIFGSNPNIPTIGASGAIFGVLIAYGLAFPNRKILLWFIIPVSARTLVALAALFELYMTVEYRGGDGVARFAHLGGMLVGYIYLKQETLGWRIRRFLGRVRSAQQRPRHRSGTDDPRFQARIDEILEKISREGMGSLTDEEKRLLRESAERARRRQQGHDA